MSVTVICPGCGGNLRLDEQYLGRKVRCTACGTVFNATEEPVPVDPTPPPPRAPAPPPEQPQGANPFDFQDSYYDDDFDDEDDE